MWKSDNEKEKGVPVLLCLLLLFIAGRGGPPTASRHQDG